MTHGVDAARRNIVKLSALGLLTGGVWARADKVAAEQAEPGVLNQLKRGAGGPSQRLLLAPSYGGEDKPPAPSTETTLPRAWHQSRMAALFAELEPQGVQAVLLRNVNNTSSFAGYWVFPSERPQAAFKNRDDEAPFLFHPVSYNEILADAWKDGERIYFDFPHADGAFPNEGIVRPGPAVDLFAFLLEGLKEKGIQGGKLGIDGELYPSELAKAAAILPNVEIVNIAPAIRRLRIVKTPEELALYSRAYALIDRAHAFARDYLITYGSDITDLELETVTQLWLSDQLYASLGLGDGRVNKGAASRGQARIRTGRATGSPHPNQPYYSRFAPGDAIQLTVDLKIYGCGGESYRVLLLAERNGRNRPLAERLWQVGLETCDLQRDLQIAGAKANEIAAAIHRHQITSGVQRYIYHRAAHGTASEGHYPPFIALGDETVLPLNSVCSQEPGLYDPVTGTGVNWSDSVVTGARTGYRMSHTPYSREWSFLRV